MKPKHVSPTIAVPVVRPRRNLRWLDSLMWLAIAGTLAALLVPAQSGQTASQQTGRSGEATASTGEPTQQSRPGTMHGGVQYFPAGDEFILQNEADFLNSQNAPPPPGSSSAGQGSVENAQTDDSPRVTTGPTLNGPELGNPVPR